MAVSLELLASETQVQGGTALMDKSGRRVVPAFINSAYAQDDAGAAKMQWRKVAS